VARRLRCGLIVLATTGAPPETRADGQCGRERVRRAPVPVLIVRPRGYELVDNVRRVSPLAESWDRGGGVERFGLTLLRHFFPELRPKLSRFPGRDVRPKPEAGVRGDDALEYPPAIDERLEPFSVSSSRKRCEISLSNG